MKDEIWVVEFNLDADNYKDHRSWNIGTFENCILSNFDNFLQNNQMDKWIVVGHATSYQKVKDFKDELVRMKIDKEKECY